MDEWMQRSLSCLLLLLVLAGGSCSGGGEREGSGERYHALRADALDLYLEMHPLRGSSLGRAASDSLLFTYSEKEIRRTLARLSDLEQDLRTIPASGLDARRIEDSRLLLNWIRGERFALRELEYHRLGPLLYCWILEETLWGVPRRVAPPHEGELEAYEKRRNRIPALLRSAAANISNPARPHMEFASQRVRRLIGNIPSLEGALRDRYGREAALPDSVTQSITGFLGFIEGTLSSQTRGNMILGTELIAKIFRYGEMIDLDPAGMIGEGEKQIRSLRSELAALRRDAPDHYSRKGPDPETIIERIAGLNAGAGFSQKGAPEIGLSPGQIPMPAPVKNVNLGIPGAERGPVRLLSASALSAGPCSETLAYEEGAVNDPDFLYHALRALSTRREERRLCIEGDTVRTLLGSDLFTHIIRFLETDMLLDAFPDEQPWLRIMSTSEKIRALARMTVFFEIHAGTMTTEAAIDYLRGIADMSEEEAASDVMAATYAPSTALPGIALLYIDRMIKKAAERRDSTRPGVRLLQILQEHYYLPPAMVIGYLDP